MPKSSESKPTTWRDVLAVHPAADMFPLLPPDELKELAADIRKNGVLESVTILQDADGKHVLLDGRNRYDALESLGNKIVHSLNPAKNKKKPLYKFNFATIVNSGQDWTDEKIKAFVISANVRRRHLDAETKRKLIAELLKADPAKSDRQIAAATKVDHKTVGAARKEAEGRGEIPRTAARKDTTGRTQPTARKTKPKPGEVVPFKRYVQDANHASAQEDHALPAEVRAARDADETDDGLPPAPIYPTRETPKGDEIWFGWLVNSWERCSYDQRVEFVKAFADEIESAKYPLLRENHVKAARAARAARKAKRNGKAHASDAATV
jgi:ParB-like nuclease domain